MVCLPQWLLLHNVMFEATGLLHLPHLVTKKMWSQYWSAHQRFFKYLCMSAKVQSRMQALEGNDSQCRWTRACG